MHLILWIKKKESDGTDDCPSEMSWPKLQELQHSQSVAITQGPGKMVHREDLYLYRLGLWSQDTGGSQALEMRWAQIEM